MNPFSCPLILTSVPASDPPSWFVVDSLRAGASASSFHVHHTSHLSHPLPCAGDIDPVVIVPPSFATQQFSRQPCEQTGLRMGVGSDYPELAAFFCGYF